MAKRSSTGVLARSSSYTTWSTWVVIAQAGHHLEEQVSPSRLVAFAVIFSLAWIPWTNGSLYLELHGRGDGRTRSFAVPQIGILAIVAVYVADAGAGGPGFAISYAAFL